VRLLPAWAVHRIAAHAVSQVEPAVRRFIVQRWFLIALFTVLVVGIAGAAWLEPLAKSKTFRDMLVATVMFVMALPLEARAMWRAITRPGPPLLAVTISFGLLPLVAWGVSFGFERDLAHGLLVAAATPCTLASAAVWTRRAGGNDSVAILVTIITNVSCFIVTPLWVVATTGASAAGAELSLDAMVRKLAVLVVLPMLAAQVLRLHQPLAALATRQKLPLSVAAQCGVLAMVFLGAISTGIRLADEQSTNLTALTLLAMLAAVVFVHLTGLSVGVALSRWLKFDREDEIAVAFAGSQKTLMVGLLVAMALQVSILPMIAYHVSQLFVDTLIADQYRKRAALREGSVELA